MQKQLVFHPVYAGLLKKEEIPLNQTSRQCRSGTISIGAKSAISGLFYNTNSDFMGPEGKIVFPRSATMGDYNGRNHYYGDDLTVVVKDGKIGYISISRLARNGKIPSTSFVKPEATPMYSQTKYYLVAYPYKQVYKIGQPFEIKNFIIHSEDVNGVRKILDNSKVHFMVSNTVKVTDGYKFTQAGIKKMECYYDGVKTGVSFEVLVLDPAETGDLLDNGTYTIGVNVKYLKIVNGYIELWDTKPADKFIIKLVNYDKDKGPKYYIMTEGGQYVAQGSSKDGDQLYLSNAPHIWRINKYTGFCTIRDYGKQKLLVNASGEKSSNGTKIIVWSHSGSAPDNAKLTITAVK